MNTLFYDVWTSFGVGEAPKHSGPESTPSMKDALNEHLAAYGVRLTLMKVELPSRPT